MAIQCFCGDVYDCHTVFCRININCYLHILNIKNLRKGLSTSTTAVSKTMSTVLAAIIIIFLISNIPSILINELVLCNVDIKLGRYMQIFWMVSCSTNPFVFFLCSKSTKTVLVNVFTCKRLRK